MIDVHVNKLFTHTDASIMLKYSFILMFNLRKQILGLENIEFQIYLGEYLWLETLVLMLFIYGVFIEMKVELYAIWICGP